MLVRSVLPITAVALGLIAPGHLAAQSSSSVQVRPAQVGQAGPCDALLQQVEIRMSTALAVNVASATEDVSQARELCNSGRPQEGIPILRHVLSTMNNN